MQRTPLRSIFAHPALFLTIMLATAAPANATDLARIMPEGTLIYLARAGDQQIDAAARDTSFGKLLAEPQMRAFLDGAWNALDEFARQQADAGDDAKAYDALKRMLETLARRPVAVALIDGGMNEKGPFVEAALVAHLGAGTVDAFVKDVDTLIEAGPLPPIESATVAGKRLQRLATGLPDDLYYGAIGDHFVLAIGRSTIEKIVAGIDGVKPSLADSQRMKLPRARIGGSERTRAYTLYLDAGRLITHARALLPMITQGDEEAAGFLTALIDGLGLARLQSIVWEQHYDKQGCRSGTYVYSGGDQSGPLAKHVGKPLTDDDLACIPRAPHWAFAANLDLAGIYRQVLSVVKSFDAEFHADMTAAIGKFENDLDLELDADLLALIGDTLVAYDAPENGGIFITGITGVVESSNPDRLRRSLRKIVRAIADAAGSDAVSVQKRPYRGHTIEFVNVPGVPMPVAPAWAAHENRVIIAMYPQMVMAALDRLLGADPRSDSLLANADFVRARGVLGKLGSSVSYVDTKATVAAGYPWLLLFGQMGASMAQGEGVQFDMSTFPTQRAITRHLFSTVGTTRRDADGVLYAAFGPLPLGGNSLMPSDIGTISMLTSIMLPSLSRARELSKRTVCGANLRGIGRAMYIHAQNGDKFPPDFKTLIADNNTTEKQFVCPSTDVKVGDLNACYEYIKGQTVIGDPQNVLMYEKEKNHSEGGNVLFQDGHVEYVKSYTRVEELVKETRERLAKKKKP